ncbi:hypothetical protein EVAR_3316_1 [Eumeta japonica]|uniref:Uncharacterized protein n=1 Tax=Eumeta variegata TaxID=151549 RepID=A0A4C1SVW6_EUMVA|nr:hypothetical protein EVAR_3316_1 [Eumeta japonica]
MESVTGSRRQTQFPPHLRGRSRGGKPAKANSEMHVRFQLVNTSRSVCSDDENVSLVESSQKRWVAIIINSPSGQNLWWSEWPKAAVARVVKSVAFYAEVTSCYGSRDGAGSPVTDGRTDSGVSVIGSRWNPLGTEPQKKLRKCTPWRRGAGHPSRRVNKATSDLNFPRADADSLLWCAPPAAAARPPRARRAVYVVHVLLAAHVLTLAAAAA